MCFTDEHDAAVEPLKSATSDVIAGDKKVKVKSSKISKISKLVKKLKIVKFAVSLEKPIL